MNEIEKMYENARIESVCDGIDCGTCTAECNNGKYPEFTAEKQLKLIKWLAINKEDFGIHYRDYDEEYRWVCGCEFEIEVYRFFNEDETFEESLAGLINMLWQNKIFGLTDEQKQQIKEILE